MDVALAGVEVAGTRVAIGGTGVAVGGFVGVFSAAGALVGDDCAVTCIQAGTRTALEKPEPALTASRASTVDGMSALPIRSKPSAALPATR